MPTPTQARRVGNNHLRRRHPARTPMMGKLRDEFELQLRGSFVALQRAPTPQAFNAWATVIDTVRIALQLRHQPAEPAIEVAAWTLIDMKRRDPLGLAPHEEPLLLRAIEAVLEALKRISLEEFYAATKAREGAAL